MKHLGKSTEMGEVNKSQATVIGYLNGKPIYSVSGGHDVFELDQAGFRARNDDDSETAATWIAAANANWTQDVDVNFRIRFLVQEIGAGTLFGSVYNGFQYRLNSGTWTNITGSSSVVQFSSSIEISDGGPTSQQLGSGTFVTGWLLTSATWVSSFTFLSGDDEVENEICIKIIGADVSDSDSIEIRCIGQDTAGTVFTSYTNIPNITANKAAGATTKTKTVDLDARVLSQGLQKTVSLDSKVQKQATQKTVDLDARVQAVLVKTVDLDAKVLSQGLQKTVNHDSLVQQQANQKTVNHDALVLVQAQKTVDLDARVLGTLVKTVDLDANVLSQGLQKTVDHDALVLVQAQKLVDLDARVQGTITKTVDLDSRVLDTLTKTVDHDALVQGIFIKTVDHDAKVFAANLSKTVNLDAVVITSGGGPPATANWNPDFDPFFLHDEDC